MISSISIGDSEESEDDDDVGIGVFSGALKSANAQSTTQASTERNFASRMFKFK